MAAASSRVLAKVLVCLGFLVPAASDAVADDVPPTAGSRVAPVRGLTAWVAPGGQAARVRVQQAYLAKEGVVRRLLDDAGVRGPVRQLLFRVFKDEMELEVWASARSSGPLVHVATYPVCAASGGRGPKSRQWDGQVPEGFYRIEGFNPSSRFHLSMRVGYPNAWDRRRSRGVPLGGDIMIHGNCVSIGCLAMTDEGIRELWVLAEPVRKAGGTIHVHIFPQRDVASLVAREKDPALALFWRGLADGLARFDRDRVIRLPQNEDGLYVFGPKPVRAP
jgi:murein L,D-transpeptidase YafK